MKQYIDGCVDCGLPCLGSSCEHKNQLVIKCDVCGSDESVYHVGSIEMDLCNICVIDYLKEIFSELCVKEQAELLGVELESYEVF